LELGFFKRRTFRWFLKRK